VIHGVYRNQRSRGTCSQPQKETKFICHLLVSIDDDIYFLESENPKGWMAKVETRGLISKVGYKRAHESHNTQHLSLASLYTLLFAMDYVYLFSPPLPSPPLPLSQNS
jgi:hypothetical protein